MPHRHDPSIAPPPERPDPFDRFVVMWDALMEHRRLTSDMTSFRFAAVVLASAQGDPDQLVAQSVEGMRAIKRDAPRWNQVLPSVGLLLSAAMVKRGDDPTQLWPTVVETRSLMRAEGLPRNQPHEVLTAWVLRSLGSTLVGPQGLADLRTVYRAMKRKNRWLTGPTDYPLCAYLSLHGGPIEEVGERVSELYEALRGSAGLMGGNLLHDAAQILAATGLKPQLAAERVNAISDELRKRGRPTRPVRYDELAMCCFLSLPVEQLADLIVGYHDRVKGVRSNFLDSIWVFPTAVNLGFLRLMGHDPALETLSDLKAVLDLLAIIAGRQ